VVPDPGACLKCQGPIPAARRADSRFCADACKLAAEYERRRLDRRLANLESNASSLRIYGVPKAQLDRIQTEIDQAEARLRVLLGGG
jgi:predicted nucleic acid-binding Zn ribbon protein